MYKGLSISTGFFSAIMILFAASAAMYDRAYSESVIIASIGMLLAWISVVCWRRSPASTPPVEVESEEQKKGKRALQVLGAIVFLVLFYFFAVPSLVRDHAASEMVSESISSYNLIKGTNNNLDICAYAGIVASAMIQAKDVEGYKKWKAIQTSDCERAGIPGPK